MKASENSHLIHFASNIHTVSFKINTYWPFDSVNELCKEIKLVHQMPLRVQCLFGKSMRIFNSLFCSFFPSMQRDGETSACIPFIKTHLINSVWKNRIYIGKKVETIWVPFWRQESVCVIKNPHWTPLNESHKKSPQNQQKILYVLKN